jgi:hypothetical protein
MSVPPSSQLPRLRPSGDQPGARAPAEVGRVWWLTGAVAALAALSSVLGLSVQRVYGSDAATAEMLRGYDAVTLLLAVPGLLLAVRASRRGSPRGHLVAASLLAYLAYTYAYYLFGTGFTELMLLHVAVFSGALLALGMSLAALDVDEAARDMPRRHAARAVAGVLGALAAGLGLMWLAVCVAFAVGGDVPAGSTLVESDTVVHLGIVLDLAFLVPLYAAAAVLLWRHRPWGYILAAVALVAGTLHQVSYLVALLFQYVAGVPGAVAFDPVEPVIILLYGVATTLLFRRSAWV